MEIWKDIEGYEGAYKVSNAGRVWSVRRNRELAQTTSHDGYKKVDLWLSQKRKKFSVHRLVLIAFEGIKEGMVVNHKDGNKSNNHLNNLEWCSVAENNQHKYDTGLQVKTGCVANFKISEEEVRDIRRMVKNGATNKELYAKYEHIISQHAIRNIARGRSWKNVEA